ncbi:Membrane-bound lytic murein transglycosylase D precursor [Minicystis rosea]|nr:Membrane-bound lytic murein transglycosylase D precursor [Minicystis rosea]
MAKLSAGRRRVLLGAAVIAAAAAAAASSSMRASCAAAYVAFRDPSRVRAADEGPLVPVPAPAPLEIDAPDLSSDFDRVTDAELGDAGTLSSLLVPDLQVPINQRTMRFVTYFATEEKGRQAFAERFRRAGRYRPIMEQALRDAELPEDLIWMAAILSGFEPQATSPKGAAGLFQFMPETAQRYGLAQSEWVDERRSIPRATQAAVVHLRELFDRYGQWDLAIAAYNMGYENLDEAIEKLKKRRGPREAQKPFELKDLAEARLIPRETASFVPQVHAFAIVAANRGRFGLDDLDVAAPFELAEIAVPADTPLRLVARAAGVSIATLRDYNPELLRDRTPPGASDVIVNVPADKVATALTALPVILAKEQARLAASAAASASAAPSASAPEDKPAPSASASAAAAPAAPASDRFTLANGVVVERRPKASGDVTITARVEILEPGRGERPSGEAFETAATTVPVSDLQAGLERAAQAAHKLATDGGEAATAARRRAGAARRQALSKTPYGGSWLALGDRLFGAEQPLSGAVLAAPVMPLQSISIADPGTDSPAFQAPLRVVVVASGPMDRGPLATAAERAFAEVMASHAAVSAPAREERIEVGEAVPSSRVLFGWLVPTSDENERAALRLAVIALAHEQLGRAARALLTETHVAVRVRGLLDAGATASVAAIEAAPSVLHDVTEVERELLRALEGFAERGPTDAELASAKEQLRARLQAARARAGTGGEPKDLALARIAKTGERAEAVTAEALRALVQKAFVKGRRVVVTTVPRK